jgi:hypothetical protein
LKSDKDRLDNTKTGVFGCPLMAQSVCLHDARPCPELGLKPTCRSNARTSQFDPKRTIFKGGTWNSNFEVFFPPAARQALDNPRGLALPSFNHIVDASRKNERQLEARPSKEF